MGTENQEGVSMRELYYRGGKFQLFLVAIRSFLLFCLFLGGLPAFAQVGQKYSTGLNNLTPSDGLGSLNYEGLNFYTNNIKRGWFTKDGVFYLLTRGYFLSNVYCDSLLTSWKISTQEIQTVTATITGNAQIGGTLTVGGVITIDGANSRISSSSGTIDFDANNLTTTGNISAGNLNATGGVTATGLTVNGTSSFAGAATFGSGLNASQISAGALSVSGNAYVDSILTAWKISAQEITSGALQVSGTLHALKISADTLLVNGAGIMHALLLTDGVVIQPFAGTTAGGVVRYNTNGKLKNLDFPTDTNAVLTGGGAFKNIGTMVAPYSGWQWYNTNVLLSTAPVVAIQNNLAVGGKVSIGSLRMSNGSATDTLTTDRRFALEAEKIFLKADTVIVRNRLGVDKVYSPAGALKLEADTVTISGLQVTESTGSIALVPTLTDTVLIDATVQVGRIDSSKIFPPTAGKVALEVAGDLRSSGAMVSNRFMFDDQYGVTFDANLGGPPTEPPSIFFGRINAPKFLPLPCLTIPPDPYNWIFRTGTIQSLAYDITGNPFSALTLGSAGWSGNGIIEVEGTDLQGGTTNGLMINYFCGRNTLINTNSGLTNKGGWVFMGKQVNMAEHVEIGNSMYPINVPNNVALEIHAVEGKGIKFKTWNNAMPLISVENLNFPGTSPFTVYGDGRVGIGDGLVNFPAGYLLAVKGKIIAEDVKLKLYDDGWPDYVYAPGYKRPSWLERKNYHEKNSRMLYMESAPDVKENGLTLSRNLIGLTRNMEEAWLDIIVLHEENETLKEEIMQLKKKIEEMEKK